MTMPDLWSVLHAPPIELLGWTLLHFVWQGVLVAAVLAGALYLLRNHSPRIRYIVSCVALLGLFALPVGTGMVLSEGVLSAESSSPPVISAGDKTEVKATSPVSDAEPSPAAASSWEAWVAGRVQPALPWIAVGWVVGVLLFSVRLAGGAWRVRRLRRESTSAPSQWRDRLEGLTDRMGLHIDVALRISDRVDGPMVAGWWRPVVLVPAGFLTGLPPEQVEALLLHELAHVRRHDVLVGRLQTVVETLLFFHPATWWISRTVRRTREACCDDLAVRAGTDRTVYARALAALAERTLAAPRPTGAMAANNGALFARIRRLLVSGEKPSKSVRRLSIAVALVLLLGVPTLIGACASQQADTSDSSQQPGTQEQTEAEQTTEASDFLLVIGTTEDGFDLKCGEGCAWTELSFSTAFGGEQAVDQYGMTTLSEGRDRESSDLANFLITVDRTETEAEEKKVLLECKKGCAWKTLTFGGWDKWEQVRQPVDQNGMTKFSGDGEGEPGQLREQSRRLWGRAEQFEDWAEGKGALTATDTVLKIPSAPDTDTVRLNLRVPFNPDSLERVLRARIDPDSIGRVFREQYDPDSLVRRFQEDVDVDGLVHHADSLRAYLDSFRRRVRPRLDSFRRRIRPRLDSLRRRIRPRLDSLRKQMGERWREEMPGQLRGQARRLREQAERLEERAEEMDEDPPTDDPQGSQSESGD